mmetsp:Transcript_9235/g.14782  ORF Transcript_9235/g.14782 Transcript_9235/m.14782 type:complete len:250 (+) Transcript_9235:208-957(+)
MMKLALSLALLVVPTLGFTPTDRSHSNRVSKWELNEMIMGEALDSEPFDSGSGGVRLAEESAIKLKGEVKHKPGKADAQPKGLLRYNKLTPVDEAKVKDILQKTSSSIICTGQGVELYKDPGETVEKVVFYSPMEAIKDAFAGAAPAIECKELVFNFLGGDDLMLGEVLNAANELVIMLDINTRAKISFNSLCFKSVPEGTCAVTVVSVGDDQEEGLTGAEKSISAGEVYARDGQWWTVDEAEINTAVA